MDTTQAALTQLAIISPHVCRFGRKSFLASVFELYRTSGGNLERGAWNDALIEAHRAGHLRLSRADLVPAMDREMVDASEVCYGNATFHFVQLPD